MLLNRQLSTKHAFSKSNTKVTELFNNFFEKQEAVSCIVVLGITEIFLQYGANQSAGSMLTEKQRS